MKICPHCSFANEERVPTCVVCNTVIVDVPATPSADPDHPEHEQRALSEARRGLIQQQIRFAAILYGVAITFLAVIAGVGANPPILLLYFASSVVVVFAVVWNVAGQFTASALQGLLSLLLVFFFGPIQLFTILMLVGHIILPGFLWHWIELIYGAHR